MRDEFGQKRLDRFNDEINVLQNVLLDVVDKLGTCDSSIVDDIRRVDEQISFIGAMPPPEYPRTREWHLPEYKESWEDALDILGELKLEYDQLMLDYRDTCKCPVSTGVAERELNQRRMNIRAI